MKKWLCLLLALCMLLSMAACSKGGEIEADPAETKGSSGGSGGGSDIPVGTDQPEPTPTTAPAMDGYEYDTGNIKVLVPAGWKEFDQTDIFSDSGEIDPSQLVLIKDGESDFDMFFKPYIQVRYNGPSGYLMEPDPDFYDETEDLGVVTTGSHSWTGFSGLSFSSKLMILWEDLGEVQLQATIYYETDEGKLSLDDADVQAILSSIEITDPEGLAALSGESGGGEEPEELGAPPYDWWSGDWYGWWSIVEGTGIYKEFGDAGSSWDAYGVIDVKSDNTGDVTLWYGGSTRDTPIATAQVRFSDGESAKGAMELVSGTFFPTGHWYFEQDDATTMTIPRGGWYVDPADSTVSQFEDLIEIIGYYEDPENPDDTFEYRFYLRHWGETWEDVRDGDVSGCIYTDMMPIYYDDWYLPLLDLGYTEVPDSFDIGADLVDNNIPAENGGGQSAEGGGDDFVPVPLDIHDREGADGHVDMETLQRVLKWIREVNETKLTYDDYAAQFGVHGKSIESAFEGTYYFRWWYDDDNYIQVAFKHDDNGNEVWNNTQWRGID